MDIQTKVKTALNSLSVPVFLGTWQGTEEAPTQYITFTTREKQKVHADDYATEQEYTVYIEIWSATNYLTLLSSVKTAMKNIEFNMVEGLDIPDNDTMHYSMTWYGVL